MSGGESKKGGMERKSRRRRKGGGTSFFKKVLRTYSRCWLRYVRVRALRTLCTSVTLCLPGIVSQASAKIEPSSRMPKCVGPRSACFLCCR